MGAMRNLGRWISPWKLTTIVLAILGIVLLVLHYLIRPLSAYMNADLETQDRLSSVANLWIAVASMILSVGLGIAAYLRRPVPAGGAGGAYAIPAGMVSVRLPYHLPGDQVRGRDAMIAELSTALLAPGVHVLYGLGGAGKTTVAQCLAESLKDRKVDVWWVSAATRTDLHTGMQIVAGHLGVTQDQLEQHWAKDAPEVLWGHLARHPRRWLLVVDNADDPELLTPGGEPVSAGRGWLREPPPRGAILVTSKFSDRNWWGPWCQLHLVGMLSPRAGARVLQDGAGALAGTDGEAAALAERLGGLPLALRLAGRHLADANQVPVPGAITTYEAFGSALASSGLDPMSIVNSTWEMSLDLLDRRGYKEARRLLRLMAVFAATEFPYRLLLDPAVLSQRLSPRLTPDRLIAELRALTNVGLIEMLAGESTGSLRMHPVLRDVSRLDLKAEAEAAMFLGEAVRLLTAAAERANREAWEALTPHALHIFAAVADRGRTMEGWVMEDATEAALQAARSLAARGRYVEARDEFQRIYDACRESLGPDHRLTLIAAADASDAIGQAGRPATAREQLAEIVPRIAQVVGEDDPQTLIAQRRLAYWTGEGGDYVSSRDQFAVILPRFMRQFGEDDPETLFARRQFANAIGRAGDPAGARDRFRDLLRVHVDRLGEEDPETLTVRRHIAFWTGKSGDFRAARDMYENELLPLHLGVVGDRHPFTLSVRRNIARWAGEDGDPATARDQFAQLVELHTEVYGLDHPNTLIARAYLARWTGEAGDAVSARDQLIEVVAARLAVSGPEAHYTLVAQAWLAEWTGRAGDPARARDLLAEILPVRVRVSGPTHHETVAVRERLEYWTRQAEGQDS